MLIHDKQIEAFRIASIERFQKKMLAFVREKHARKVAKTDDDTLLKDIALLMKQANGFGLKKEYDIMLYVSYNYFCNWNCMIKDDKILALFKNPGLLPKHKFQILKGMLKK